MIYYVYMLECSNDSYYTGYTSDINRRYQEHLSGSRKCKYTRSFPPKSLAICWKTTDGLSAAMQLESKIKRLSRTKKRHLVENPHQLSKLIEIDYNYFVEDKEVESI